MTWRAPWPGWTSRRIPGFRPPVRRMSTFGNFEERWLGRQDSNLGVPVPKTGVLDRFTTPQLCVTARGQGRVLRPSGPARQGIAGVVLSRIVPLAARARLDQTKASFGVPKRPRATHHPGSAS